MQGVMQDTHSLIHFEWHTWVSLASLGHSRQVSSSAKMRLRFHENRHSHVFCCSIAWDQAYDLISTMRVCMASSFAFTCRKGQLVCLVSGKGAKKNEFRSLSMGNLHSACTLKEASILHSLARRKRSRSRSVWPQSLPHCSTVLSFRLFLVLKNIGRSFAIQANNQHFWRGIAPCCRPSRENDPKEPAGWVWAFPGIHLDRNPPD